MCIYVGGTNDVVELTIVDNLDSISLRPLGQHAVELCKSIVDVFDKFKGDNNIDCFGQQSQ